MDNNNNNNNHARRPPRPAIGPPPRRLFPQSTTHAPRPIPRTTTSKPATVHIPPDTTPNPSLDLVERDSSGAYKIVGGPPAALRLSATPPLDAEAEEKEQEDHMIALCGRSACHWDQSGAITHVPHAGGLVANLGALSLEDGMWDEPWERDDGWGFYDANARIEMWDERREDEREGFGCWEREGWCHWENRIGEHLWMEADRRVGMMEEVKGALKAGVKRAVGGLEGDRWMFEGEKRGR